MDVELFKGSLSLLILSLLRRRAMYGYEIATTVATETGNAFELKAGSLYPSLHLLEKEGHIRGEWRGAEGTRQRKYYHLTPLGRRARAEKLKSWHELTRAIHAVLDANHEAD